LTLGFNKSSLAQGTGMGGCSMTSIKRQTTARAGEAEPDAVPVEQPLALSTRVRALAVSRAADAFRGFSLSKYRDQPPPATHVPAGGDRAAIHRTVMEEGLRQLRGFDASSRGLTLSLRPATLNVLRSYNADAGTVDATDLMILLDRYRRGTEFYSQGHPTVTRLELQRRAQELIASAVQGEAIK
jgi:hypothetical protein